MSRTSDLSPCPTKGCNAWIEPGVGACLRCALRAERDDVALKADVISDAQALEEPAA